MCIDRSWCRSANWLAVPDTEERCTFDRQRRNVWSTYGLCLVLIRPAEDVCVRQCICIHYIISTSRGNVKILSLLFHIFFCVYRTQRNMIIKNGKDNFYCLTIKITFCWSVSAARANFFFASLKFGSIGWTTLNIVSSKKKKIESLRYE